MDTTFRHILS